MGGGGEGGGGGAKAEMINCAKQLLGYQSTS